MHDLYQVNILPVQQVLHDDDGHRGPTHDHHDDGGHSDDGRGRSDEEQGQDDEGNNDEHFLSCLRQLER